MRRIGMVIAYDGTAYAGWQKQENGPSVQQTIEDTIERLFHERVSLMGSGRTDAGVHAQGQVAAMDFSHPIPTDKLKLALNSNLPEDIRIYQVFEAAEDFHPRFQAKQKTYIYRIWNGSVMPPSIRQYAVLIDYPLDVDRMNEAAALLLGEHDFKAFRSSGGMNLSTVRRIYQASFEVTKHTEDQGQEIVFTVTGNGFLYNMVRIMVGTLLEIGSGKREIDDIRQALDSGDRTWLGPTAPAKGLCLFCVDYEKKNL
ncbi:MAG: tRNA pseudouridine(38-40) synthase TruA [Firmicutes bacterium]|nr:tRNA pseudouridine(38-40) synthase TruA [Bacillota bacterium]